MIVNIVVTVLVMARVLYTRSQFGRGKVIEINVLGTFALSR